MPLDSIAVFSVLDRVTNSDGTPVSEGTVEFYLAGTSTPLTVYSDYGLTSSLGTTVSLNSAGYPVSGGGSVVSVYTGTSAYKIIVKDADGATISDLSRDNIKGAVEIPVTDELALPETPVVTKTSAYSIVDADQGKVINANCTGGSFVLTLPSAVTVGDGWRVAGRHVGTANVATIRTTSSQTIDIAGKQVTSFTLKGRGQSLWLVSDGANWHVDGSTPAFMQDGLPYFKVTDRLTAPPTSPTGGARYIANGTPTGAWSTLGFAENQIIEADGNGSWFAYTPDDGYLAYVEDEALYSYWNGSAWTDMTNVTAPTTSALKVAVWADEKSTNTSGGTPADDTWTTHTLNTERTNTITGSSLSGSQFTLPTGKYLISAQVAAYAMSEGQIRLYSVTNSTVKASSVQVYTANYVSNSASILSGAPLVLTAYINVTSATEVFALQYYSTVGGVSSGLGRVRNIGSETEVYAIVSVLDLTSIQGPTGEQGTQGTDGLDAAYPYQWSTSTSGDPGSGKIRGNNATIASITEIAVSETDSAGGTMSGVIDTWDSGTSSVKARIKISKEGATQNFHYFYITGAGTDQGSYWTFPVSYTATSGTIANNDDCAVLVLEKGDKGDTGAAGVTGSTTFTFSTTTTDSDPGAGVLRLNNATAASATAAYIDNNNSGASDVSAWLDSFDDTGESAFRGHLHIYDQTNPTTVFRIYKVTGSVTDGTGYRKLTLEHVTGAGSYTNGNTVILAWLPRGATGVGDTTGAASSTDNALVRFDGTGGKTLQNSVVTISDTGAITLAPSLTGSASSGGTLTLAATSAGSGTTDTLTAQASVYQLQSRGGAASYFTIDASGHAYIAGSSSFATKDLLLGRTQGSAWMTTTNVISTQGESASSVILNDNIYTSAESASTVDNTAVRGVGRALGSTESYTPNSGITYVRGGEFHALMSDDAGTTGNVAWGVEIGVHNQRASLSRADGAVGVRIHSGNDGWFPSGVLRADAAIYVDGEAGFDYLYAFYDTDNATLLAHVNYLGEAYFAGQVTSGRITATSTNAAALAVGRQGSTNPVLQVDASASTVVTGLKVTGAAAAGGAALAVISSGTNEALTIDAKGSGTITLNGTGTGNVTTPRPLRTTDATGSSSTSTGSLVTSGGLGVGENVRAAGLISAAAASGFYLGTTVFAIQAGNYRAFYNGDGAGFMTIGNSVDESFYLDSNTITFRTRGTLTSMGTITSSGWSSPGAIKSTHATSGVGYATGAGGTVTQSTSKSTGVTLNKASGQITMHNAALAAGTTVGFTLTNSAIASTDSVIVNIASGATADSYILTVDAVGSGSCRIEVRNTSGGSLGEAIVLNFAVIKGVTS